MARSPFRTSSLLRHARAFINILEKDYRSWWLRGARTDNIGAVTGAWSGDDLTGWVRADVWTDHRVPVIGVYRGEQRVGLTIANQPVRDNASRLSFAVHVDGGLAIQDLVAGHVAVFLLRHGFPIVKIPISPALRVAAANEFIKDLLCSPAAPYEEAIEQLEHLLGNEWAGNPGVAAVGTLHANRGLFHHAATEPLSDPDRELTSLLVPVGIRSADKAALLGRGGHIFLIGGTNRLLEEYVRADEDPVPRGIAQDWLALIERRKTACESLGVRYVQAIFPEKLTVLPHFFPEPVRTPGVILRGIEAGLACRPDLAASYVSARHALETQPDPAATMLKTDSHFSPLGCCVVFRAILEHLGFDPGQSPTFDTTRAGTGDLATRFFGIPIMDTRTEADLHALDANFRARAVRTFQYTPTGRVVGSAQSWQNPDAPIDASILVVGNSYCGAAEGHQGQMSWWFARWFRTYHFVWRAHVPPGLVEKLKPDIVLCHTVERFLIEVPET